ncbi:MAG: sodium/proline symporter [Chlamydiia bacterium]|nr:sodium/proline symporter [Chlamydiia bacterium]
MTTQVLLAFFAYFSLLLSVGLWSHRKMTNSADFIMGGRSLNFWLTALTAHASDMSAWLFMAFPAAIYMGGMQQMWIGLSLLLGMLFTWLLVAKRLRLASEHYHCYTLSSFFEKRFQDKSGTLRILTALMTLFFLCWYIAAGLIGMGRLLESVFDMNYYLGLSVAILVAVIYTFVGGFVTVAWTDAFQATFLLGMILLVPAMAATHIDHLPTFAFTTDSPRDALYLAFGWGLGYFGMPHIITKFMGIKNPNEIKKAMVLGISWQAIALIAAALVGLIGIPFFHGTLANPELVFIEMVQILFHPFISGFILCAVFAATMSTMDSQILVCASVFSEDLYQRLINPSASQAKLLATSRLSVLLFSAIGLLLAFYNSPTVYDAVYFAWAGLGSTFGPLVIMALFFPSTNRYGAIAGLLIGGCTAILWPLTASPIPAMIPAFTLNLLTIPLVSSLRANR